MVFLAIQFLSFRAGFKLLSCLGEYLSCVKLFPDSMHILLEMSEQLAIDYLYQVLVKVGHLFKYLSWAIIKYFCHVPESGVHFLSQFFSCDPDFPCLRGFLNFYSYFSFTNLVVLFYLT